MSAAPIAPFRPAVAPAPESGRIAEGNRPPWNSDAPVGIAIVWHDTTPHREQSNPSRNRGRPPMPMMMPITITAKAASNEYHSMRPVRYG